MGDFLRTLIDIAEYFWPFETIYTWQRGCYYVCGRYWKTIGPGVWLTVPYFTTIFKGSITPDPWETPEQTIELRDGTTLTFTAAMRLEIYDMALALNAVTSYRESAVEDAAAVLAERLATSTTKQVASGNRRRLVRECEATINGVLAGYGCRIGGLRFTNFIRNIRTYRVFGWDGGGGGDSE